jgi:hypothetical protein
MTKTKPTVMAMKMTMQPTTAFRSASHAPSPAIARAAITLAQSTSAFSDTKKGAVRDTAQTYNARSACYSAT